MPPDPAPMDFNAWFDVFLGGKWYTFDARHNMPRIGRILIARGRDAADIPLVNSFGPHILKSFRVWTQGPGTALRGAKVTLLHMLDGTLRVRFKDRDLAFTPFKTLPVPPRSRTIRPSTPASTRSSPETRQAQPEAPARAWITAWLATALWGARFAKPLSTPNPLAVLRKGTFLLCLDKGLDGRRHGAPDRGARTAFPGMFGLRWKSGRGPPPDASSATTAPAPPTPP